MEDRTEQIKNAKSKYNSYDSKDWENAYFDEDSGGFNVYHKDHKFTKVGGGGEAEIFVGKMLAKMGKQVEFLPEGTKKGPDLRFDGKTWDIKTIDNANEETIRKYIKDARKADNAIFYFTKGWVAKLNNATFREVGKFIKENRINELPDIYYMDKNGLMKLLWKKEKGG